MNKTSNLKTFDAVSKRRVSFIIATKNRAEYLDKLLDSVKSFKTKRDELIVIDGYSNDATIQIIKKHSKIIDQFISEPDLSPSHAVNKGFLLASGKYILQLTDDDQFYVEGIKQAIEVMEKHPEVDLLVCGGTKQYGTKFKTVNLPPNTNYGLIPEHVFEHGSSGVGFFIRRRLLSQIGLYPTSPAADTELILKAIHSKANIKFCRIKLYNHVIFGHSVTQAKKAEYLRHYYSLMKEYCSNKYYWQHRLKKLQDIISIISTF